MASIVDDRGFNQGFEWTRTAELRMRRRADAILAALDATGRRRMMELGCGTGELASMLGQGEGVQVTGVDLCQPFVDQARARFGNERVRYECADLSKDSERARLGDGWTAVVGNGILHHLYHHIEAALGSFHAMLAPGGRFVFWEPNLFNPYVYAIFSFGPLRAKAKLEPDEMAFTPSWIRGHLVRAGFTDVEVSFRDFLLPNVPWALAPALAAVGDVAERVPLVDHLAQSLFISATKRT